MQDFISYTVRVVIVYIFTYLSTRTLSKKAIAEMTAYEVAGLMIFANVAAEPLVDKVVTKSVYGTGFLVILMLLGTKLAMKNKFTAVMEHTPTFIMENGQVDKKKMAGLGLTLNQLEGLLRQQGYDKMSELDTIIMEPQGNISAFPKAENKQVTIKDLKLKPNSQGITIPLIMDGNIIEQNLKHINKTKEWLLQELKKKGIVNYRKDVMLLEVDSAWKVSILKK